jgi:hypothetical protein
MALVNLKEGKRACVPRVRAPPARACAPRTCVRAPHVRARPARACAPRAGLGVGLSLTNWLRSLFAYSDC